MERANTFVTITLTGLILLLISGASVCHAEETSQKLLQRPSSLLYTEVAPTEHAIEVGTERKADVVSAPEPTSLSLLAFGLAMFAAFPRVRKWLR